jgi:hypothetical protein
VRCDTVMFALAAPSTMVEPQIEFRRVDWRLNQERPVPLFAARSPKLTPSTSHYGGQASNL